MLSKPAPGDALLIIDMQNDFLPRGALAVAGSDALIPLINRQIKVGFSTIIATRDWHPAHHVSFASGDGPWPAHCIAGTEGAELTPYLELPSFATIFDKGTNPQTESYSAFKDAAGQSTGLAERLSSLHIDRVYICGVALDYCVKESALDSARAGFETYLLSSLTCAIGAKEPILKELEKNQIKII